MAYHLTCECGESVRVELFQAGTNINCPACRATVSVPDSITLQEMAGDRNPFLRPLDKIRTAVAAHESPFDGICQQCRDNAAEYETPVGLEILETRVVHDNGGIRPSLGGLKFVVGAAEEHWLQVSIPLLLCRHCQSDFQAVQRRASIGRWLKSYTIVGLLIGFIYVAHNNIEAMAALSGFFSIIGAIAWSMRFRHTRKGHHFVTPWLANIRWAPEVLASESEYNLRVGQTRHRL